MHHSKFTQAYSFEFEHTVFLTYPKRKKANKSINPYYTPSWSVPQSYYLQYLDLTSTGHTDRTCLKRLIHSHKSFNSTSHTKSASLKQKPDPSLIYRPTRSHTMWMDTLRAFLKERKQQGPKSWNPTAEPKHASIQYERENVKRLLGFVCFRAFYVYGLSTTE